jgi:hypothetical protein
MLKGVVLFKNYLLILIELEHEVSIPLYWLLLFLNYLISFESVKNSEFEQYFD